MKLPRRRFLRLAASLVAAPAFSRATSAQAWPTRPIRLLNGYPPGGASDIVARVYAQGLQERLGAPVVVENRGGSGGNLAVAAAVRATPDGYTLLHGNDNMFVVNPHVYTRAGFDPLKELVAIASVAVNQLVMVVHPSVPATNLREFVELARKSKPPLFYASIGNGSMHHLAMERFKRHVGIELTHVPYRGGGPAAIALLAGEVSVMLGGGAVVPNLQAGQFRGLAATGAVRNPATPDLPTVGEIYPGYEAATWHGLFAPVGVPSAIIERLRAELAVVLAQPEFAKRLVSTGSGEPYVVAPEVFVERIRREHEQYGQPIRAIGLQVQ